MEKIIRTYFYYLRNAQNAPVVTVCIGFDNDKKAYRGVSVCSDKENPIKRKGKSIAKGRMLKAFNTGINDLMVDRDESTDVLFNVQENMDKAAEDIFFISRSINTFMYKSEVDPSLTKYEQKLKDLKG